MDLALNHLRRFACCVWLLFPVWTTAQSNNGAWQQVTNYNINVTLNDATHTMDGVMDLEYINQSPDTLHYIWFHLWPNAYKNDKTTFAQQHLLTGNREFYFSRPEQKGYINRLDFRVDDQQAELKDHPQYIDVGKLELPTPLPPGKSARVTTPFHVQLPYRYSRMGYSDSFYAITQWFPKAAVYDKNGWHPMPYLELGEYYADFGKYKVEITLPEKYMVAATGMLQTATEREWLMNKSKLPAPEIIKPTKKPVKKPSLSKTADLPAPPPVKQKTISYIADQVVDFAWFAYPGWQVKYESIQLNDRQIDAWNFVLPADGKNWENSMIFTKDAINHYSNEVGPFPYPQVTVVGDPKEGGSGMEYPMITGLNTVGQNEEMLQLLILHEIGHNWFQAILANNERANPWMDEGLNTYIERKWLRRLQTYEKEQYADNKKKFHLPLEQDQILLDMLTSKHIDQPISTSSADLLTINYYSIPYTKTALWLEQVENKMGSENMSKALHQYFDEFRFRHVHPDDLKKNLQSHTDQPLDELFDKLRQLGPVTPDKDKPSVWPIDIVLNRQPVKMRSLGIAPAIGFNEYDKLEAGLIFHNFSIPVRPFQWVATPMYGTGSKQLTGYGRVGYTWFPQDGKWLQVEGFASAARFSTNVGSGAENEKLFAGFTKYMPGIYAERKKKYPLSTMTRWMELKSWIINERSLASKAPPPPGDTVFYSVQGPSNTIVIPQFAIGWNNNRALYPYSIQGTMQQAKDILRLTADAKYFFNYDATGKGIRIRAFAGKIFYLTEKTEEVQIANNRYHFSLYGPNGTSDYTYSTPFVDRNQSVHMAGRQIMERDGFFKYRSDFSSVRPGLSPSGIDFFDNWLASLNFEFDIPDKVNPLSVLPFDMPLKVFADVGTSASPWRPESEHEKFLYSIGLHLPILKVIHVYLPIIDSKAFKEPNSVNDPNKPGGPSWWQKKLTFSFDLQPLKPKILNTPLIR